MLTGSLWPVHYKLKRGELLSSWIVRLAYGHGQILHTFCQTHWPGIPIWNRDFDRFPNTRVLTTLADRTATSDRQIWGSTLEAYRGVLADDGAMQLCGSVILPLGIYHRTRRGFGTQFCAQCLAEDADDPWVRRLWRVSLVTVCTKHRVVLHDRCPACRAPFIYHRALRSPDGGIACPACRRSYSRLSTQPSTAVTRVVDFQRHIQQAAATGWMRAGGLDLYAPAFVDGVLFLARIALSRRWGPELRRALRYFQLYIPESYDQACVSRPFDRADLRARYWALYIVSYMLKDWPDSFHQVGDRVRLRMVSAWQDARYIPLWLMRELYGRYYGWNAPGANVRRLCGARRNLARHRHKDSDG